MAEIEEVTSKDVGTLPVEEAKTSEEVSEASKLKEHRSFSIVSKDTGKILRSFTCSLADAKLQVINKDEMIVPAPEPFELRGQKLDLATGKFVPAEIDPIHDQMMKIRDVHIKRAADAKLLFTSGSRQYVPDRQRLCEVAIVGGKLQCRPEGSIEHTTEEGKVVLKDFLDHLDKLDEDRDQAIAEIKSK